MIPLQAMRSLHEAGLVNDRMARDLDELRRIRNDVRTVLPIISRR